VWIRLIMPNNNEPRMPPYVRVGGGEYSCSFMMRVVNKASRN
jgi:hypothetical protein